MVAIIIHQGVDPMRGARLAELFQRDHPDRPVGWRHCVIYGAADAIVGDAVVYRTKAGAVVVRAVKDGKVI